MTTEEKVVSEINHVIYNQTISFKQKYLLDEIKKAKENFLGGISLQEQALFELEMSINNYYEHVLDCSVRMAVKLSSPLFKNECNDKLNENKTQEFELLKTIKSYLELIVQKVI